MMKSKQALKDAWLSYNMMTAAKGSDELRIHWISTICLLRAIGHVLDKVDAELSLIHKEEISNWWKAIKRDKPSIFWDFINESRNLVVKEYDVNFITYECELISTNFDGSTEVAENPVHIMKSGDELFGIVADALLWWEVQLKDLERSIQQRT
ncbi:hypothetical protein [Vibrio alfacsensis]|uniref:hypothetical protein n=1 Tax=Vibrio alfacsensis TaxID=1074311 RepID=UPI0040696929